MIYFFQSLVQVSVGTLLAFTVVAISILILRYAPPNKVPLPSSLQEYIDSVRMQLDDDLGTERKTFDDADIVKQSSHQFEDGEASDQYPLIQKQNTEGNINTYKFVQMFAEIMTEILLGVF